MEKRPATGLAAPARRHYSRSGGKTTTRVVSAAEARDVFLLVEKRWLSFFPAVAEPFDLDGLPVAVEARDCTCRGPERPHQHWRVHVAGLRAGSRVEIERLGERRYTARIHDA